MASNFTFNDKQDKQDRGPFRKLRQNDKTRFFPDDLETIDHWIVFYINRYKFFSRDDFRKKENLKAIFLPIPTNLETSYSQSYSNEGIGAAGKAGTQSGFDTGANIDSLVGKASQVTKDDLKGVFNYYGLQAAQEDIGPAVGAAIGGISGAIAGAAGGQFIKGAVAGAGIARNPHYAVLYQGPNFRTHTFSYKLVAKDENETSVIKDIIKAFKYHSSPGYKDSAGHFFDYPDMFDIDFHYPDFLFNIAPSVLTEVGVNYHSEGVPEYFFLSEENKAPVSITLSLTFQETNIVTKQDIEERSR